MAIDHTATTTYASNRYAPRHTAQTGGPVGRGMSAKQRDFVATLVTRADDYMRRMVVATPVQGSVTEQMRADALAEFSPARTVAGIQAQLNRTDVTARTLIDNLVASDKALAARVRTIEANAAQRAQASGGPAAQGGAEDGQSYRTPDGRVFHAYLTQRGILCVKLWTPNGETDEDGRALGEFVYYGAARRMPADAVLMTLEDAAAFGQATGTCSQCMRHLTNDESVAAGIGPVCAGRM